ncbi:MAG: type VI secretion system tip protein VgrG [Bacteroidales bacterium]|nr:type VI secretion system tip protein VgrG [Bacteroidales bacterium]
MISPARATIQIEGDIYSELVFIELSQQIHQHHSFRIGVGSEHVGEESSTFLEKASDFTGKDLSLEIINERDEKLVFRGIITRVRSSANLQSELGHQVVIEGYSPTILLENGAHCSAFVDSDLSTIVNKVIKDIPSNSINPVIEPVNNATTPYTVQYNESNFNFINRLACRNGEWFYFDGNSLVLGTKDQPVTELYYGTDLISFDMGMSISPLVQNFMAYSYKEESAETMAVGDFTSSMSGYTATAMDRSGTTYTGTPSAMIGQFDEENALAGQLESMAQLALEGEAARKVTFSGVSIDPAVFPGVTIKISHVTTGGTVQHGEYIVTSAEHHWSTGGKYQNKFTAIPADATVTPMTNTTLVPRANTACAKVIDNNDPDGMGRIKVRFPYMPQDETPWLRITTPYAGADKGIFFIPEVDEEVMIAFENGNAEKPYVIGSLYTGNSKPDSFVNDKNDFKAIRSRTGHTIQFTDTKGEECITISDIEGNTIMFNTAEKVLSIVSVEDLEISAKNIKIAAEETIEIGSGKDTTMMSDAGLSFQSQKDFTVKAQGGFTAEATKDVSLSGQNLSLAGKMKADIEGTQTTLAGKMTAVQGASGKVEVM